MTGPHDRVAAREDVRARVPCRAEACVRAREAVAVRPVRCWRVLVCCDTRRGALGFSGRSPECIGFAEWACMLVSRVPCCVWVWCVVCGVCAVWHECALKWRVACRL